MRLTHSSMEERSKLRLSSASALSLTLKDYQPTCPRLFRTQSVVESPIAAELEKTAKKLHRDVSAPARANAATLKSEHVSRYIRAKDLNDAVCPERSAEVLDSKTSHLRTSSLVRQSDGLGTNYIRNYKHYSTDKLDHIEVLAPSKLVNGFRQNSSTHRFRISRKPVLRDYVSFEDHTRICKVGSYTLCAPPPSGEAFSYKELVDSTLRVAQIDVEAFAMKAVELGLFVKALADDRNTSPGVPAAFALYRRCRLVSSLNADPWVLSTNQVKRVVAASLPWYDPGSLARLVGTFDPQRTGYVRFVRIFLPALAYFSPLVNDYTAFVEKHLHDFKLSNMLLLIGLFYDLYVDADLDSNPISIVSSAQRVSSGIVEEDEDRSVARKHFSGVQSDRFPHSALNLTTGGTSQGMRLDDLFEALTSCACDKDERARMQALLSGCLGNLSGGGGNDTSSQQLFIRPTSPLAFVKHARLRSIYTEHHSFLRIKKRQLLELVQPCIGLLQELECQLNRFRKVMTPYVLQDVPMSFAEHKAKRVVVYGTRHLYAK